MSKLEPNLVQPSEDNGDVNSFLREVDESSDTVAEPPSGSALLENDTGNESGGTFKRAFQRLEDFLSRKSASQFFSRKSMAHRAYLKQQHGQFLPVDDESQFEAESFSKSA